MAIHSLSGLMWALIAAGTWLGCSGSARESADAHISISKAENKGATESAALESRDAGPSQAEPDLGCQRSEECTIVRDACYRPYPRALKAPGIPEAPAICPPATYAVVEPHCLNEKCVARSAESAQWRMCQKPGDCMALPAACGGFWAVAKKMARPAGTHLEKMAANRLCKAPQPSAPPRTSCIADICVLR